MENGLDWVTLHKSRLMRGRFYGRILDDSETDTACIASSSEDDDIAPAVETVDPVNEIVSDDEVIVRGRTRRSLPDFLVSSDEELEHNDDAPSISPPLQFEAIYLEIDVELGRSDHLGADRDTSSHYDGSNDKGKLKYSFKCNAN